MNLRTPLASLALVLSLAPSFVACSSDGSPDTSNGAASENDASADDDLTTSDAQAQLNGLRSRVAKDFPNVRGYKLVFVVRKRQTDANRAFIQARIMKRDARGRDSELSVADLKGSVYGSDIREGLFDGPEVTAALKKNGPNNWSVMKANTRDGALEAYVVGPTDVAWTDWGSVFSLPRTWLF